MNIYGLFRFYLFKKAYGKIDKLGDRLARVHGLIDWEAFRPIVEGLFVNDLDGGGRPNVDEVVVKLLVLQQ